MIGSSPVIAQQDGANDLGERSFVAYCSDCHGSDAEMMGDPKGPHGSNLKFMLKGVNQYWPTKADGATLYELNDISGFEGDGDDTGLFCKNCHDINYPHSQWQAPMGPVNSAFGTAPGFWVKPTDCVACHVAIPHGSPVSRLIGYKNFPSPYNYKGNSLKMQGYKKTSTLATPGDDDTRDNIYVIDPGESPCDGCHHADAVDLDYDANPYP